MDVAAADRARMAQEEEWLLENQKTRLREERALAAEKDRLVRVRSAVNDTRLNLPVSVSRPEAVRTTEPHRRSTNTPRHYDPGSEIQKAFIQGPPNRTVFDSSDWEGCSGGSKSNCCSGQLSPKSSSPGQVGSFSLSWSRSGKSPPLHSRSRCHHQRHSHPSKNSCSLPGSVGCKHKPSGPSTTSSTATSLIATSDGCEGLIGAEGGRCKTSSSIGEKLHSVFTEKVQQCANTVVGNSKVSLNNNSSVASSVLSRLTDGTKGISSSKSGDRKCGSGKKSGFVLGSTEPSSDSQVHQEPPKHLQCIDKLQDSNANEANPVNRDKIEFRAEALPREVNASETVGTGTDSSLDSEQFAHNKSYFRARRQKKAEERCISTNEYSDNLQCENSPATSLVSNEPNGDNHCAVLDFVAAPVSGQGHSYCINATPSSATNDQTVHHRHQLSSRFDTTRCQDKSGSPEKQFFSNYSYHPQQYCSKVIPPVSSKTDSLGQEKDLITFNTDSSSSSSTSSTSSSFSS